ncbi:MAG: hypothetical protein ACRESS_11110 [Stenotrophobium sp.]
MKKISLVLVALLALGLGACAYFADAGAQAGTALSPVHGVVPDNGMDAFHQFIASLPTPAQFRAQYPDVQLILPGEFATKELRLNNSRYFAQLNQAGRITGGKFM